MSSTGHLGSVLVLDGDREVARQVSRQLGQQNWTSVLSFNPEMALKLLKNNRFHLLMFDAYVDGKDTLDNIERIRQAARDTPLAIMAHTWEGKKGSQSALLKADAAGVDFTIAKPVNIDRLKVLLKETHQYHRARKTEFHVLIVDPDIELRNFVGQMLKQVGYQVSGASTMEDVFFDHNLGLVDAVLTAILIPGIGGVEGIAQLRKDWPHIRVVAMSEGINDKIGAMHVLAAAREAGAEQVLPKPFVMPELLKIMSEVSQDKVRAKALEVAAAQAAG
jgi:DNA-binding response OmpR family regulator